MHDYANWVAGKIATLQNNLDIIEDEGTEGRPQALLVANMYEGQIDILTQSARQLGFTVQLDGPRRRRTAVLRLDAAYTSHNLTRRAS